MVVDVIAIPKYRFQFTSALLKCVCIHMVDPATKAGKKNPTNDIVYCAPYVRIVDDGDDDDDDVDTIRTAPHLRNT